MASMRDAATLARLMTIDRTKPVKLTFPVGSG
jgi:hypothetical protein